MQFYEKKVSSLNIPGLQILEVNKFYYCENPDAGNQIMKCELLALNPEMTHALVDFDIGGMPVIAAAHELKNPCLKCGNNPDACGHGDKSS